VLSCREGPEERLYFHVAIVSCFLFGLAYKVVERHKNYRRQNGRQREQHERHPEEIQ
jgi:hypothetical protein